MAALGKAGSRDDLKRLTLEIGHRVRRARKIAGLTQTDLASRVGVSLQQVQKYEGGINRISAASLTMIATALDVSAWSLLGDTGETPLDPLEGLITVEGIRVLRALARLQPELRVSFLDLIEAAADRGSDRRQMGRSR